MSDLISDSIAERVRLKRRELGWSQDRLAEECTRVGAPELTRAALANIECGRRDADGRRRRVLTAGEAVTLARALNVATHAIAPELAASPTPRDKLTERLRPYVAPSQLKFVVDLICELGEERG